MEDNAKNYADALFFHMAVCVKASQTCCRALEAILGCTRHELGVGSVILCSQIGDGSAREQAASSQRILGGWANIATEYVTKRYRSNVMNWGMIPFQMKGEPDAFEVGSYIYVPGIRGALDGDMQDIKAYVIGSDIKELHLYIADMTPDEKKIVKAGCLINYNRNR